MLIRTGIIGMLIIYDLAQHNDFHQMYIADEGNLEDSLLKKMGVDFKSRLRKVSVCSERPDSYRIKVDEKIVLKKRGNGIMDRFFIVNVYSSSREFISCVEKTYDDFKAFRNSLEYQLRESGIKPPELEKGIFDVLMPSSDEIFKYNFFFNLIG